MTGLLVKQKIFSLIFVLGLISFPAFSNDPGRFPRADADTNAPERRVYLGLATGFNNSTGMFGVTCEVYLYKGLNAIGGLGLGTWGYKPTLGLRYYFDYPYRYAIGIGYSYAYGTGSAPVDIELDVADTSAFGTLRKPVSVILKGVSVLNFTLMKFWRIGRHNRFNIEVGYAQPFKDGYAFRVVSDERVTLQSRQVLKLLQPGGVIFGASFSFRL